MIFETTGGFTKRNDFVKSFHACLRLQAALAFTWQPEKDSKIQGLKRKKNDLDKILELHSRTDEYVVVGYLGEGSSGKVVLCWSAKTGKLVAIKMLKEEVHQREISILQHLGKEKADEFNIVQMVDFFSYRSYSCLAMEALEQDLRTYMGKRNLATNPLPLCGIRLIMKQILSALVKLKDLKLIHADLKPENIMLVDQLQEPYNVKIIDFGNAIYKADAFFPAYIQTRYYRAPEVILGLPFSEKIDVWSTACIAAELYLGRPLFPGRSEYDQIRCITKTQGYPSPKMLDSGAKTVHFFRDVEIGTTRNWILKTPKEYERDSKIKRALTSRYIFRNLGELVEMNIPKNIQARELNSVLSNRRTFVDLLRKMLVLDPKERISAEDALNHAFFKEQASRQTALPKKATGQR